MLLLPTVAISIILCDQDDQQQSFIIASKQ